MTKLFDGLALGGPLDGKRITHHGPYYCASEQMEIQPYPGSFKEMAATVATTSMDIFTYVHFQTHGGDVWVPKKVHDGKRYEHKIYSHPMEFVFSKLIRGYRPEGY
ncbi:hypothetical protein [Rhizobium rhizogenes]|uniref:hypothetical protein n=1 Tax=Rhizobium rhizogenes TaxID=359 RepID=UPI0015740229|nr:hypothetical protein [Rhizobium rhizogenes]NTG07244.1 hypothetical protein [Rhizobium rhizogenes]